MAWVWADNTGTEIKPDFIWPHYFELFASQFAPAERENTLLQLKMNFCQHFSWKLQS